MTLLGCVLLAAACADLGGVPGDATRATIDSAAARDHGSEATPSASPSPSLAERIAYRPPGCPEPLPPMPDEALEAYAGTCLVPEVWGRLDDAPGFMDGGMIDPTVSDDIYVYWSGEVDPASQAAIDQAALDGVHVEVRYVRFSEDQHSAATSAIVSALTDAAIGWSAGPVRRERRASGCTPSPTCRSARSSRPGTPVRAIRSHRQQAYCFAVTSMPTPSGVSFSTFTRL